MSDPGHDLFGLMRLAERNQDAVGKASKHAVAVSSAAAAVLKEAAAQHQESVNTLTKAASVAIADAVKAQAADIARPLQEAAKRVEEAAQEARNKLSLLHGWVMLVVFLAGVCAGAALIWIKLKNG